jgi:hypothetical protein
MLDEYEQELIREMLKEVESLRFNSAQISKETNPIKQEQCRIICERSYERIGMIAKIVLQDTSVHLRQ